MDNIDLFFSISDYAPLIQLLVGSIFLAKYFSNNVEDVLKEEDKSFFKQFFTDEIRGIKEQASRDKSLTLSNSIDKQYKSGLIITVIFGCISLFYCATCHNLCCTTKYLVSCIGPIVSTSITVVYFIWFFLIYGHIWRPWYGYFTNIMASLLILSFLMFFCIDPFPNIISEEKCIEARPWITISMLGTLLLFFTYTIKKWVVTHIYVPYWKDVVRCSDVILPKKMAPREFISKIINYIKNDDGEVKYFQTKIMLLNVCCSYLKKYSTYLYSEETKTNADNVKDIINKNKEEIEEMIKNSGLKEIYKKYLIEKIPKKNIKIDLSYTGTGYPIKMGYNIVRKLNKFGLFDEDLSKDQSINNEVS